jgi:hypothetical protein
MTKRPSFVYPSFPGLPIQETEGRLHPVPQEYLLVAAQRNSVKFVA